MTDINKFFLQATHGVKLVSKDSDPFPLLRVMVLQDGELYSAIGLDIYYVSSGATPEEARANFFRGLKATAREHKRKFGNLNKFLRPAPSEIWDISNQTMACT